MRILLFASLALGAGCSGPLSVGTDGSAPPGEDGSPPDDGPSPATPLRLAWERLADDGPAVSDPGVAALGDVVVLFGGVGAEGADDYRDETWVWEAGAWTMRSLDPSPSARRSPIFAEVDGRLILFGGVGREADGGVGHLEDTWAFDGTSWTELHVEPGPSPRQEAAAASLDGALYVHGGATRSAGRLDDGWRFDGTSWSPLPPGPPAQRAGSLTAVDGALLFTGGSTPVAFAEVLRLDADGWTELGSFTEGRAYHVAAAIEGRLVVFGGVRSSTTAIAETDAFPGPVELEGDEPAPTSAASMVSLSDGALMHVGGGAPQTWRLRAR